MIRVEHGDMLEVVPRLVGEGIVVDAIVTDPPYHLTSGNAVYNLALTGSGNPRVRRGTRGGGFMGKQWDGGDMAFRPETWAALLPILKPGGYLLAFGGTRTHHRLWCAVEDAGFVIQDTIMWLNGQGFPKGKTQLKPSFEPICVAYKPGGKRGLQIDECRIEGPVPQTVQGASSRIYGAGNGFVPNSKQLSNPSLLGRWPANVCHDGSDEVMEAFAAFGTAVSGYYREPDTEKSIGKNGGDWDTHIFKGGNRIRSNAFAGESGSPARFYYAAKASKADRAGSRHPTVKPVALMRWLVRLVTPPDGLILDPFAGSGSTGAAALIEGRSAILIEREAEYVADIRERLARYEWQDPTHAQEP